MLTPAQWDALMVLMPRSRSDTNEALRRVMCDGWTQVRAAEHYSLDARSLRRTIRSAREKLEAARILAS